MAICIRRREFVVTLSGAAAVSALGKIARTETYPARPVRIVVAQAPGSGSDIAARVMGQWLSDRLGQQFVVENRPGAGGNIGTEVAARALPDGYTILLVVSANTVNATLYNNLSFNFVRDIAPVAGIFVVPLIMEVHPSFPAKSVSSYCFSCARALLCVV